jgi:hypothetical protein
MRVESKKPFGAFFDSAFGSFSDSARVGMSDCQHLFADE